MSETNERSPMAIVWLDVVHKFADAIRAIEGGDDGTWRFYMDLEQRLRFAYPDQIEAEKRRLDLSAGRVVDDQSAVVDRNPLVVYVRATETDPEHLLQWNGEKKIWTRREITLV